MPPFGKEYSTAYDELYSDKDYGSECDFLEEIFSNYSGSVKKILDLGCGTGGHALSLAGRGYEVTGVDRSPGMLEVAENKAEEMGRSVRFEKRDITDICLGEEFDAVISMFAVMSYQTTNRALSAVCGVARGHLGSGGLFLFDCWHGPAVLKEKPSVRVKEVDLSENEKIVRFTEPVLNVIDHTVETRFKIWRVVDGNLVDELNESHLMRFLFPQEIKYHLEVAGFKKIAFFPFLELGSTLTEDDWNMMVVATA